MITLKDVKKAEPVIDSALKNGANQLQGIDFRSVELRRHRDQARSLAIQAAKEKAIALAHDLDCTVGAPRTINESGSGYLTAYSSLNSEQEMPQVEESNETLPLGQISIRAAVNVTFDLLPEAPK
jgi:uncharacterized protein YggE